MDSSQLLDEEVIFNLIIRSNLRNSTIFEQNDLVEMVQKLNRMSDQNPSFSFQLIQEQVFKNGLDNFLIKGRNWIIHQYDVSFRINSSRKTNSSFLPSTKVDASLSKLSLITTRQNFKI
jgi:hypothetical protein